MEQLIQQAQLNCHISDARYAGNYTLCIYLLKMREFYRWEKNIPYGETIGKDEIGRWLVEREQHWDDVEEQDYQNLDFNQQSFNPFESQHINRQITAQQLIYSGGYGILGKPVFFLAELERVEKVDDYSLYIAGKELARDLAAPPGMTQGQDIYIRRESLQRFIWEKKEESLWHKQSNPLSRALGCYAFEQDAEQALKHMTDAEIETVIQHEIGEIKAGQLLGDSWNEMLNSLPRSQAELMARAARDHLADMITTLPDLIKQKDEARIHFYFANLSSMRKLIFPSLMDAYTQWHEKNNDDCLQNIIEPAYHHWLNICQQIIQIFQQKADLCQPDIEELIKTHYLSL